MVEFENHAFDPTFDPGGPGIEDEMLVFDLPDRVMDPPMGVKQGLHAAGDNIPHLRGKLQQEALEAQKKSIVKAFYDEVYRRYGLRPEGSIDYNHFRLGDNNKTLYWTPEKGKEILVTASIPVCGSFHTGHKIQVGRHICTAEITRAHWLWIEDTTSKQTQWVRKAEETLPKNTESIKMTELPGVANDVIQTTGDVETTLKIIDDQPINTAWVTQAKRELAGIGKAMTRSWDKLVNNMAKLTAVNKRIAKLEEHLDRESQKLAETNDPEMQQEIRDRISKLEVELSDTKRERKARLEAASTIEEALWSQIFRIRETFRRLLHEDKHWLSEYEHSSANKG